ncbi:MAG: hypothetical protein K2N90_08435, partial [Lachnospiraceae bacterium]|nr:hypothetical protein [Lachnospiraceae bacterium]
PLYWYYCFFNSLTGAGFEPAFTIELFYCCESLCQDLFPHSKAAFLTWKALKSCRRGGIRTREYAHLVKRIAVKVFAKTCFIALYQLSYYNSRLLSVFLV